MANANNIMVINDEAHHAWRVPAESKVKGVKKEDIEEAKKLFKEWDNEDIWDKPNPAFLNHTKKKA